MKLGNTEAGVVMINTKKRTAIVQKYRRGKNTSWGIAKDMETGDLIHFRMNCCHKFMTGKEGPVFTDEYKDVRPQIGDIIVYILDTQPVGEGKLPSVKVWNYETSYQACLEECIRLFVCDRPPEVHHDHKHQPQVQTTHMQLTATNGHEDHGVRAKKFSKHRHKHRREKMAHTSPEEKNWGYKVAPHLQEKKFKPMIDLEKEFSWE